MRRLTVEFLVYAVMITVGLGISIIPDILRIRQTPPGTTFPLIHNHHNDYFSYLGYMHSGLEGDWLTTVRISSAHYQPQFIYTFFVALGHLSRILGVSLPWMYFSARLIFGAGLLASCVLLARRIFPSLMDRMTAIFFIIFGTGFWKLVHSEGTWNIEQFLTFWTRFDPVLRTTFLPHHTAATMLVIFSLLMFHSATQSHRVGKAISAGLLGFTGGILYHGAVTNMIGAFVVVCGIILIGLAKNILWAHTHTKHSFFILQHVKFITGPSILYCSISALSLLYVYYLSQTTWPWTISNNLSHAFTFSLPLFDYFMMLGPTMILAILGTRNLLSARSFLPVIILGWAIFPFLGIFGIAPLYPKYGNMIFMEAASYIPFGILAVYGMQQIRSWTGKYGNAASVILTILIALYSVPAYTDSIGREFNKFSTSLYNFYIPNTVMDGFRWLDSNTPKGSTVLAGGFFGAIIPAFTHNYVVVGDDMKTYLMYKEQDDMLTFFRQTDPKVGKEILEKYRVRYVFYSLDTDPPKPEFVQPLGMTEVYAKDRVVIYKVQ